MYILAHALAVVKAAQLNIRVIFLAGSPHLRWQHGLPVQHVHPPHRPLEQLAETISVEPLEQRVALPLRQQPDRSLRGTQSEAVTTPLRCDYSEGLLIVRPQDCSLIG